MHCRSFFDRCCAHCCCARFLVLSVTVLGPVGGAPGQGWGGPRASRACFWWRLGSLHCVLGVQLRMGMAVRRPSPAKKIEYPSLVSVKPALKMRDTASTNGKRHWFSRYACTAASRCNWSLRFVAVSLICYPAKDSLLERRGRRAPATQKVVGGRSGHSAPSSRGDAAG